jgi:hypothetical protein
MASKSASNRRSPGNKRSNKPTSVYDQEAGAPEDALAYEHGYYDEGEETEGNYVAQASERVRGMTRGREGRIVVAALASGFAVGTIIGCVIASSRQRQPSWTDRLACEGLGRRLLDRLSSAMPEALTEKFGR